MLKIRVSSIEKVRDAISQLESGIAWVFVSKDRRNIIVYDASTYTRTKVMKDVNESGFIGSSREALEYYHSDDVAAS